MRLLTNYPTYDELDRLFDAAFGRFSRSWQNHNSGQFSPATDLFESEEAYHARMEMPGFQRDQLDISLENAVLTIKASIEQEAEGSKTVQTVNKQLRLPEDVDSEHIAAHYEDGILTLTLPKSEQAKPKQITVS